MLKMGLHFEAMRDNELQCNKSYSLDALDPIGVILEASFRAASSMQLRSIPPQR
mgnify:CR=1 FL=1